MKINHDETTVLVGVEVGTSKVVAAVAELRRDGSMTLLGVGEAPSSGIRKGEIVDFQDAQACIRQALHQAEKMTDAEIGEVYVTLTGPHIMSRTDSVRLPVLEDDKVITQEHLDELNHLAHNLVIPRDYVIIHSLLQNYYLDNHMPSREPVGVMSGTIEGKYHLIYGLQTRLQTTVRCIREMDVDISGYALSALAMSNCVLSSEDKKAGAIAIDIGAGVVNYIVYVDGDVAHTGVLGLGGDHLTQDLAIGLRLPYQKAEALKKDYGDLFMQGHHADERITLSRDVSFEERAIYRESMVQILRARQQEILNLIAQDVAGFLPQITAGILITGGASQMRGLQRLAEEVFSMPVQMVHEHSFDGDQTYSRRPDLSAVLGLLQFARRKELNRFKPRGWRGWRESLMNLLASMKLF